jgi:uncharacterized repeat protein (TIGR01451 family)
MNKFSKQVSIGLTAAAIVTVLPFVSQPVMASFQKAGETIAQVMQRPNVQLSLSAEKQVGQAEQKTWQALKGQTTVNPGDLLRYSVTGQNSGKAPAKKFAVTQPIPKQMVYQLNSAQQSNSASVVYSIDDGKSFVAEPKVKVKNTEGKEELRPAPAEMYSHVRWQFKDGLNPNSKIKVSYDVKVR